MRSIKFTVDDSIYSQVIDFINTILYGKVNRLKDVDGSIKLIIKDDSVYSLFIGFIKLLPSDKVKILKDFEGGLKTIDSIQAWQKIEKSYAEKNEYSEDETFQILEKALDENCL